MIWIKYYSFLGLPRGLAFGVVFTFFDATDFLFSVTFVLGDVYFNSLQWNSKFLKIWKVFKNHIKVLNIFWKFSKTSFVEIFKLCIVWESWTHHSLHFTNFKSPQKQFFFFCFSLIPTRLCNVLLTSLPKQKNPQK